MSLGATLTASFLAVLERPSTWPLALAGFLVRGGLLLVLGPIVVLPTAVGLANVVAPLLEDVAFGRRTAELGGLIAAASLGALIWLLGGGLLAAAAEIEGVRRIADAESPGLLPAAVAARPGTAWRVLAARLLAHVPFVIALVWGALRIVAVGYRELTVPSDVAVPAVWRIAVGAPDALVGVVLTWLLGETIGAMAARRVVLRGEGVVAALTSAVNRLAAAPRRPIALGAVSSLVLFAVLAATGTAAGVAWEAVRAAFAVGEPSAGTTGLVVLFVALFAGGLVLIALTAAWRAAIWTLDAGPSGDGTFGGGLRTRSGD